MDTVTSRDGTTIALDRLGDGPPVILVSGGPNDRTANAPLAELLAPHLTVLNYDRRGRGASGDTPPYAVGREVEDLQALIDHAGGSAFVYGTSSGAAFAIEAAARGLAVTRLALWEPPFVVDDSRPPVPADYKERVGELVAAGRRGEAIEYFLTRIAAVPAEFVAPMRQAPFWGAMEDVAHAIVYEADVMRDYSLPAGRLALVTVPTLVLDGGQAVWLRHAADAVAAALPDARRRTLQGQPHNVAADAVAPALVEFFAKERS
jgi:pimeloyl-ACP methyl ester carboxylesterase